MSGCIRLNLYNIALDEEELGDSLLIGVAMTAKEVIVGTIQPCATDH